MARDSSVLTDDDSDETGDETANTGGNDGLLHRRSYLKLAGSATAAAAVASATTSADEENYEVIEADNSNYFLDDGEVFENKIIDFSNGNWFTLIADGTDWTIRNVGFRGVHEHDHHAIVVSDQGDGHSVIENVYLGDGCVRPSSYSSHGQCGIFVHRAHNGHIDFRNVYVEDWPNNGIYGSAAAYDDPGTITIQNSFGKNNYVSSFRCSDGAKVVDCVAYNDGNGRYAGRPFWGWGDQEISGSRLLGGPYADGSAIWGRDGSTTSLENTKHTGYGMSGSGRYDEGSGVEITDEMDLSVPDGVPTSAEEAASGGASAPDDGGAPPGEEDDTGEDDEPEEEHDLPNVILFDGEGAEERTRYEFVVSGAVEQSSDEGASVDDGDEIDGSRAIGGVVDWKDAFRFEGEVERLSIDGPAAVRINGEAVDPDDFDDVLDNVVVVDGSDEAVTRYEFAVDGDVQKSSYDGASIDDEDVVEDGLVHGVVADWKDAFRFHGELEELTVDGPGTVYVNDAEVDPADYGEELPHVLTVEGLGVPTSYEITVDGTIELASAEDPRDEATTVSGSTVQSSITDDSQVFHFSGVITDVTFSDGEAAVYVDGEEIDVTEYGDHQLLPHAIVIDGNGGDGASAYSFTVGGEAIKSDYLDASIDDEDVIEDRTVRGVVAGWLDAYWFDGDVEDLTLLGDATARVIYNARNQ